MKKYIRESLKSTEAAAKEAARTANMLVEEIDDFLKTPTLTWQETKLVLQILDKAVVRRTNLASLVTRLVALQTEIEAS